MKLLFQVLAILLITMSKVFSQEYKSYADFKYLKDTLLINGVKIRKGDTLRLGLGSASDNSFSYVFTRPTLLNSANTKPLPAKYNNTFLILHEMKEINLAGNVVIFPVFIAKGEKDKRVNVSFSKALQFKEIIF